jgi:hypothetical protein
MARRYQGALAGLSVGLGRYMWTRFEFAPRKDSGTEFLLVLFLGACFELRQWILVSLFSEGTGTDWDSRFELELEFGTGGG